MAQLTLDELKKETCQSYGGNNCVLHGCMFSCQLTDAMKARMKEKGMSDEEIKKELKCPPKN